MLEQNLELNQLRRKGHELITNIRVACERRQLEQRKREKAYEEGNFTQRIDYISLFNTRMSSIIRIGIVEHMHLKSAELEAKLIKIHDRWEQLKARQKYEPAKFLKTLKVLKNQIQDVTKMKDDIIQTIKNDLVRINATHRTVLDRQDYDLHYVMQRINNYLTNLKQCYGRQILKLDDTINRFHQSEYERLYKCRHEFSTEIIVGKDVTQMLENIDKKYEAEREYRASVLVKFR